MKFLVALLRIVFAASLFVFLPVSHAQSQPPGSHTPQAHHTAAIEGEWVGSLQAGDAVLHLVLHISKAPDGSYKATIDSLDQGVYGIEVTSLTLVASTLRFSVSSVVASYEGKILANSAVMEGVWSQGNTGLPLAFHRQAVGAGAKKPADAIAPSEGVWQGALIGNGMRLRLQLHVSHDDQKQLVAALDSPDQKVSGLPANKVSQKDDVFHFEIPFVDGVYEGTLNATRTAITGTWTQNGSTRNLEFKRSDKLLELRRPQNPVKPYPYREEELTFPNEAAKISLAGTLTIPQGSGPFPAAILISGSGPHDRDENLDGHRPFLVLADHLTRNGIAVLRFDKRGIGKSAGNYEQAVTEDFAGDTEAALAYMKTRKEVDSRKIGLIGHSEGGLIAPLVAIHSHDVAWIVLLAGPGLKGEDVLLLQSEAMLRVAGVPDGEIFRTLAFNKKSYSLVREENDPVALRAKLNDLVQSTSTGAAVPAEALQAQIRVLLSPWFRAFLDYDPVPALQKTTCPILALNGEKDLQVPPKENLSKIKKALEDGGNKDFLATEMPGLNHLFQHAPTGSPTEYGAIEETMAPEALSSVSDWIKKHSAP
ncbi:MAG TPA: alpha/beta fold hydrolase [Candidatus Angelobacter sp.]|nr:alpha/beta fold hydrolase [Candidatus Angelobacter sp.]